MFKRNSCLSKNENVTVAWVFYSHHYASVDKNFSASRSKSANDPNHALFIVGTSVFMVAFLGSLLTDVNGWYLNLPKIALAPPNWIFGPVWTVLFLLIAWSGIIIAKSQNKEKIVALYTFGINGVLNLFWTFLFFTQKNLQKALIEIVVLWFSIILMIIVSSRISKKAAWLLVPYLAWVSFAAYLNYAFWAAK